MLTEDGSIIQACLNGESEAFGILVDKYKAGIYAFIYAKIRDFHDAQDLTQEVFLQAYRNLGSLRRMESFAFWLYRIASNHCKRWLKNRAKNADLEFIEDKDDKELSMSSINSYREDKADSEVQEALESLPDTYREVLMLYYYGGMNSLDIAYALGISPSAIRHRLIRAKKQFKEEMLALMRQNFEEYKLQASFTFRIVESIQKIRINPVSNITKLPWGISLAAGFLFVAIGVMSNYGIFDYLYGSAGIFSSGKVKMARNEFKVDKVFFYQVPFPGNKHSGNKKGVLNSSVINRNKSEGFSSNGEQDGKTANPVLDIGAIGSWDVGGINSPSVIFDGSEYKMWYHGWHPKDFGEEESHGIGYSVSKDGISWKKYSNNPVLTGTKGEWDEGGILWFTVIFDGIEYKMWYTAKNHIGLATSIDGISWNKYGNPVLACGNEGEWDSGEIYAPSVVFNGSEYEMWYTGKSGNDGKCHIGYAISPDGISWTKCTGNPVLSSHEESISFPTVIFDRTGYKMWYRSSNAESFGYATSRNGVISFSIYYSALYAILMHYE
jgi:RNA polymerase sigma factor (sigma-70 family)